MASDLQIQGIDLPSPVVGACPSDVTVRVINNGIHPAPFPVPMAVCLEIRTASQDGPPAWSALLETPVETPPLQPGAVTKFVFKGVQFPCTPPVFVKATADCTMTVPNNARTAVDRVETITKIDGMPWLWTDIRLGLEDSTGFVTWSPAELCPGAIAVTEVTLRNRGCAPAPPSDTALKIRDGAGQAIGTPQTLATQGLAAGQTIVFRFKTTLPIAVTGQSLTFEV